MTGNSSASSALAVFLWVVVLLGLTYGVIATLTKAAALFGG